MTVVVEGSRAKYKSLEPKAGAAILAALTFLKVKRANLEVYFVSEGEIRRLNRRFRGKNKPTNILSFGPSPDFPASGPRFAGGFGEASIRYLFLGEIFLAPDYALRKKESMAHLLVHGLLHLLGYTHKSLRDKIKMEALEKRIEVHLRRRKIYF